MVKRRRRALSIYKRKVKITDQIWLYYGPFYYHIGPPTILYNGTNLLFFFNIIYTLIWNCVKELILYIAIWYLMILCCLTMFWPWLYFSSQTLLAPFFSRTLTLASASRKLLLSTMADTTSAKQRNLFSVAQQSAKSETDAESFSVSYVLLFQSRGNRQRMKRLRFRQIWLRRSMFFWHWRWSRR